jgi:hypothetical protein
MVDDRSLLEVKAALHSCDDQAFEVYLEDLRVISVRIP